MKPTATLRDGHALESSQELEVVSLVTIPSPLLRFPQRQRDARGIQAMVWARTVCVRYKGRMNENFGELKARIRKLNELLSSEPGRILGNLEFARAVSHASRLVRDGDRTREPSHMLRAAVEKAELLGRAIR